MNKRIDTVTSLNKYDRKILNKYTKFYSNFIESNTAKTETFGDNEEAISEKR